MIGPCSIDTRNIKDSEIFVALKGESSDGHFFVEEAIAKGASGCIVESSFDDSKISNKNLIYKVDSTLHALTEIAKKTRAKSRAKIIAVTGSCGKTTTKEMLALALKNFKVCYSKKTYNNHIGVPLSLTHLREDDDFGVFEVGSNHPGEISELSKMVSPDIAIITNVFEAHIGNFKSLDELRVEKLSIVDGLKGVLVSDFDHPKNIKTECYFDKNNVYINSKKYEFNWKLKGYESNALKVLQTLDILGVPIESAIKNLQNFEPIPGRGKTTTVILPKGGIITLVDDSYNASPASMQLGLSLFKESSAKRKVVVLGEMLELGANSSNYHLDLLPLINDMDVIILCGKEMRVLHKELKEKSIWIRSDLKNQLGNVISQFNDLDAVFVKGSKGSKVSLIVDALLGKQ